MGPYYERLRRQRKSDDEVRKAVRYQIKHGAQLIKVCVSGGVMSLTGAPGAQHYSTEELRAIVDEAAKHGIQVNVHAVSTPAMVAAIDAGVRRLVHLPNKDWTGYDAAARIASGVATTTGSRTPETAFLSPRRLMTSLV